MDLIPFAGSLSSSSFPLFPLPALLTRRSLLLLHPSLAFCDLLPVLSFQLLALFNTLAALLVNGLGNRAVAIVNIVRLHHPVRVHPVMI